MLWMLIFRISVEDESVCIGHRRDTPFFIPSDWLNIFTSEMLKILFQPFSLCFLH